MFSASSSGGWVLGYHGCSREVAEAALSGKASLRPSTNDYDWLGNGIYFWEDDCSRALRWARKKHGENAYVVGCVISLGNCLNLQKQDHLDFLIEAHSDLVSIHEQLATEMPTNTGGADMLCRKSIREVNPRKESIWIRREETKFHTYPKGSTVKCAPFASLPVPTLSIKRDNRI